MRTFLVPEEISESRVETILDASYLRGPTHQAGPPREYKRFWFRGENQVGFESVREFGASLLEVIGEETQIPALASQLGLIDVQKAAQTYWESATVLGKVKAIKRLGLLASKSP